MILQEENGVSSVGVRYQRKKTSVAGTKVRVGRPKKRRFICEYCGKSFLHSGHFSHHIRTRHCKSQFMCLSCNEMYSSKEELVAHQQETQHTGEGMFDVHNVEPESNPNDDANKVSQSSERMYRQLLNVLEFRLNLSAVPVTKSFLSRLLSRVISSQIMSLAAVPFVICVGNPSLTLAQSFIIKR